MDPTLRGRDLPIRAMPALRSPPPAARAHDEAPRLQPLPHSAAGSAAPTHGTKPAGEDHKLDLPPPLRRRTAQSLRVYGEKALTRSVARACGPKPAGEDHKLDLPPPLRGRTVRSDHVLQHKTLMGFVARACGAKAGLVEPGRVPECAARRGADGAQGEGVTAGGGGEAGKRAEGGGAIRGAGRTGPGKRREKRARGAGRSILREGRGKGRDSVAKYGEKVSEGGGTSVPAGGKGSGGGA